MMKRQRPVSSSESSDDYPSTSYTPSSMYKKKSKNPKEHKKSAELFRKDLISAMKIPDSHHMNPDSFYFFTDTWKEEWEKGVQVPADPDCIPTPSLRIISEKVNEVVFVRPRKYIQCSNPESGEPGCVNTLKLAATTCCYDLDDMDIFWLQEVNEDLGEMGYGPIDESLMENLIEVLERHCHEKMNHAIETVEGLGIEYDEDVICDVCRSPDSEEGNDMVFCDKCNICVHQACYGILTIPEGSWLCRPCVLGIYPQCILCPKKGGAMKTTRVGTKWAHVSCALWIPEVNIASPERMEPITKISHIPPSRWALVCYLCKMKTGACIQCSVKSCMTAFHVTCAFEHGLEMRTVLGEDEEVRFRSFCLKHSQNKLKPGETEDHHPRVVEQSQAKIEKTGLRAQKLSELEEDFYTLVQVEDVAKELGLSPLIVDFVYNYWKLKRKSNFNKPLIPPKEKEENALVQPKEENIHTRMRMFMHLRQDLERVRNLCYMISRREKLKLSHTKVQEQIFGMQVQLINEEIAEGLSLTNALENSLFYPPPRNTLNFKMSTSTSEDGRDSSTETEHQPSSPGSSSPGHGKRSPQMSDELLDVDVKKYPRFPLESKSNCFLASRSHSQSEARNSSPARRALSAAESYYGRSLGKPLALQAALHGQASIGNGKSQPNSSLATSNGLEGNWSGNITQKDNSDEICCDQESVLSSHLPSQGNIKKSGIEHFSRSFKEATNTWVRPTEDLQYCVKPTKNASFKEQKGRQLLRRSTGRASDQETDGYCPDLEPSDSEAEGEGNKETARVKRESSNREYPSDDSAQESHGKSKTHPHSHSSMQR